MQLFPPFLAGSDKVCLFQNSEMLRDGLASHVLPFAKLTQCLSAAGVQPIEELPAHRIGECLENRIGAHETNMQPFGCLSRTQYSLMPDFASQASD